MADNIALVTCLCSLRKSFNNEVSLDLKHNVETILINMSGMIGAGGATSDRIYHFFSFWLSASSEILTSNKA